MDSANSTNALVIDSLNRALFNAPEKKYLLGDKSISYAVLTGRIRQLSEYLIQCEKIAIWMPKGNDYASIILAVLAHGKTYVPIDGAQPASRAKLILSNSACEILFTSVHHYLALSAEGIPASLKRIVVVPDGENQQFIDAEMLSLTEVEDYEPIPELTLEGGIDNVAAILYTSGSTGTPKGVKLSYRNLNNFIAWSKKELGLNQNDCFLNTANFNFDLSTFDLFLSLWVGGSLYVTRDGEQNNLARLSAILSEHAVTCIYTVPTLLTLMNRVDMWSRSGASSIKTIVFAGEIMPIAQLKNMALALGNTVRFYNFYGPTETNVCTFHQMTQADLLKDEPLPIGLAIDGATIELRTDNGDCISPFSDEIGEIWVTGDCVTPGYVNRPEDRNTENHQKGWHATGDLGSYDAGRIIYRGRIDRMVKINGYRIELGEIETALLAHSDIREAAVVLISKPENHIKAYVVIKEQPEILLNTLALKQYCSNKLPSYMVPHKFSIKSALEKNANGKVDYKILLEEA